MPSRPAVSRSTHRFRKRTFIATNPDKTTVGSDHLRALGAVIVGLKKIVDEAKKKNDKDENTKALVSRYEKLEESFGEIKPAFTQMAVYEGLKTRVKTAVTDFPKLAKLVKKEGEDKEDVKVTVSYANKKVENACDKDRNCAARIEEVANHGFGYLGHKAVTAIKAQGHVHVGNSNGIAFSWKSKTELKIIAYGTKNNEAKPGNSKYDWVTG